MANFLSNETARDLENLLYGGNTGQTRRQRTPIRTGGTGGKPMPFDIRITTVTAESENSDSGENTQPETHEELQVYLPVDYNSALVYRNGNAVAASAEMVASVGESELPGWVKVEELAEEITEGTVVLDFVEVEGSLAWNVARSADEESGEDGETDKVSNAIVLATFSGKKVSQYHHGTVIIGTVGGDADAQEARAKSIITLPDGSLSLYDFLTGEAEQISEDDLKKEIFLVRRNEDGIPTLRYATVEGETEPPDDDGGDCDPDMPGMGGAADDEDPPFPTGGDSDDPDFPGEGDNNNNSAGQNDPEFPGKTYPCW